MKKYLRWQILLIVVMTLVLGFYDLPSQTQSKIIPSLPEAIKNTKIHLGLDLQGGSQLDYKIDTRELPEKDKISIVEGVRAVIEKRVNGLGIAEPNIYVSTIGGESHIIVEIAEASTIVQADIDKYLAGAKGRTVDSLTDEEKKIVSLEKAKETVGKTIQLEFKEEKGSIDPQEKDKIKENAAAGLERIKKGEKFEVIGQEEEQAYPGKVKYLKSEYLFEDKIPEKIKETILALKVGEYKPELVETGGTFTIDETGKTIEDTGLSIIKLTDKKDEVKNAKEVFASHILISYAGADSADASITRTEEEAYAFAKDILKKAQGGEDFAKLAKENSDDKSNKDKGGKLDTPVTGDGSYVYDFEQAALGLEKGKISEIVKTQFGYHIIKVDDIKENTTYPTYQYEILTYSTIPDAWKDTGLTGKYFQRAEVQLDKFYQPYVQIQFDEEGGKLFEEITGRNVGKKIAIFVGGEKISAPVVNEKIAGGSAQISGQFTSEEAKNLARDLNTGAIPAPIVLTGEYTIGATLGQEALSKSMTAGIIGSLLVILFMIICYRLSGVMASISLMSYITILIFLVKSQLHLGIALIISLAIFIFLIIKVINNKDAGWEKFISFILSCFAFFFLTYLLKSGITLTLAGIAGIIISVGMAVDANVLIFERLKEEIRNGKTFGAALESGFDRAWDAIRDSHFSTLITCAILFYFGSATIKGFAFNLAAGLVVSMFSAITITRTLMRAFVGKKITENLKLFNINIHGKDPTIGFIKRSKLWLTISGALVGVSLLIMIIFGFNLGIDFQGGTLLEFKFKEAVTKDTLTNTFNTIEEEINNDISSPSAAKAETTPPSTTETKVADTAINTNANSKIDISKALIINSGETGYIIKTKYLTSEMHDKIIAKMKEKLPEFTEPRFTTIEPVVGQTFLQKAMVAVVVAMIMIILYVWFAFRKIPKEVKPWRFGACAIIALFHDVTIITAIFVLLGHFLNVEIDILFITAILTVLGYSVEDTIIIFDRVRENLIHQEKGETIDTITNKSLNQTLARSINTTMTTVLALIAVLSGSTSIFYFILALTLGVLVGSYSSIFVAAPLLAKWTNWAKKE